MLLTLSPALPLKVKGKGVKPCYSVFSLLPLRLRGGAGGGVQKITGEMWEFHHKKKGHY